jgi:hypothetical protein
MRKKTIRRLPPNAKEVAKLANEVLSVGRRLRNLAIRMSMERYNSFQKEINIDLGKDTDFLKKISE